MDPVVKEMLTVGLGSNAIMRVMNTFVIAVQSKFKTKMVSQTTIRNKMEKILLEQSKDHLTKGQKVIGMDGKMDKTLQLKG